MSSRPPHSSGFPRFVDNLQFFAEPREFLTFRRREARLAVRPISAGVLDPIAARRYALVPARDDFQEIFGRG